MIKAARADLSANRHAPFVYDIDIVGFDLTGAALHAQLRSYPDAAGSALLDLPQVTDGTNGIRFLGVTRTGGAIVSSIRLQIDKPTMEAMPAANDPGGDMLLSWDLLATPAAGTLDRWLYGFFTILAGVTR